MRRSLLTFAAIAVAAVGAASSAALAGSAWDDVQANVFAGRTIEPAGAIVKLSAPFRPKDQSHVPIGVEAAFDDGRTIRYPDPNIKESDTVMVDIATNKITDFIRYDAGALVMITGGRNAGRVGVIQRREKHKGSFEIVHVKDAAGHEFATRATNVFVIGEGNKPMISLPKGKGIKLSIVEELEKRKEA